MASNALAGTAYLKVDGTQYRLRGGLKLRVPGGSRTDIAGMDGPHGFTEKPVVPGFDYTFTDTGGLSLTALGKINGVTVTVDLINGKSYVLSGAWHSGDPPTLDAETGEVTGKFSALTMQETLASS